MLKKMQTKLSKLLTIRLAVIIAVLIIILGYLTLLTSPYDFKSYMFQYFKYDSIRFGMTKEQVQSILNVIPVLGTTNDYKYSKTFDEVLLYPIKLKIGEPDNILVFYLDGKAVGKEPSSKGKIKFNRNEFKEMEKAAGRLTARLLLLMIAGSAGTIGWFVIFSRLQNIQNVNKKNWASILIIFCLLTSSTVIVYLLFSMSANIIDALSATF